MHSLLKGSGITSKILILSLVFTPLPLMAQTPSTSSTNMSQQELSEEIRALRIRMDQLEAQEQKRIANEQQQRTRQAVIADADKHSSLLDFDGLNAGRKDGRFYIQSSDGNFVFRPWVHLQIRDTTNWRHDLGAARARQDNTQNGMELRRARFGFDGNLFSKDFTYFINWSTIRGNGTSTVTGPTGATVGTVSNNLGGVPVLEEAWVKGRLPDSDFYIKAGQMHDPLDHDAIVGSKFRAPEASLQTDIFANTDTFTQAVTGIYDPKKDFRFEGGINDGIRSNNTTFQDFPTAGIAYDWGVAGRAEYKVKGRWKDYEQMTALGDQEPLLVFGAGADNSQTGSTNTLSHTFDVQYGDPCGLFLYGAYFGRYTTNNRGIPNGAPTSTTFIGPGTGGDTYEYSFLGQTSYVINQHWEPYVRYEYLRLAGTPAGSNNSVHEISGGVNWYIFGHNAKLTLQMMYLPTGIPIDDTSSDVLANNNHGEVIFLSQFQLLF